MQFVEITPPRKTLRSARVFRPSLKGRVESIEGVLFKEPAMNNTVGVTGKISPTPQ